MKRKGFVLIAACVLAAVFAASGYQVYLILNDRQAAEGVYEDLDRFIQLSGSKGADAGGSMGMGGTEEEGNPIGAKDSGSGAKNADGSREGQTVFPEVDFEGLREINAQVAGWIYCEGNTISFPIVQGTDNEYYLKHMFNGEVNPDGSIFLDSGNSGDFSDMHNIIYGHHMNSGAMFAPLLEYKEQEYYEEHPEMLLMTPEGNYRVEIFAGYVANVGEDAWQIEFASEDDYGDWINRSISKSWISGGTVPEASDRILTLSTCSYEFDNARFVLLGIMHAE